MAMMEADFPEGDLHMCFGGDDDIAADTEDVVEDDLVAPPIKEQVMEPVVLISPEPANTDPFPLESEKAADLRRQKTSC